jgi:putative Holliday junction resolvase
MRILAVDLGKARTGLAVCDEQEILASPLCVVEEWSRQKLLERVTEEAKRLGVGRIVVGLPRNMDGSEGESAQNARAFAQSLQEYANIPVVMQDERGTTITAYNFLNDTDTRGKKRKAVVDAVAATVILQDYLLLRRNGHAQ